MFNQRRIWLKNLLLSYTSCFDFKDVRPRFRCSIPEITIVDYERKRHRLACTMCRPSMMDHRIGKMKFTLTRSFGSDLGSRGRLFNPCQYRGAKFIFTLQGSINYFVDFVFNLIRFEQIDHWNPKFWFSGEN